MQTKKSELIIMLEFLYCNSYANTISDCNIELKWYVKSKVGSQLIKYKSAVK